MSSWENSFCQVFSQVWINFWRGVPVIASENQLLSIFIKSPSVLLSMRWCLNNTLNTCPCEASHAVRWGLITNFLILDLIFRPAGAEYPSHLHTCPHRLDTSLDIPDTGLDISVETHSEHSSTEHSRNISAAASVSRWSLPSLDVLLACSIYPDLYVCKKDIKCQLIDNGDILS